MASQAQKEYIKKLSVRATQIQKSGGTKTVPAKTVFKMSRSEAVKKAAQQMKSGI